MKFRLGLAAVAAVAAIFFVPWRERAPAIAEQARFAMGALAPYMNRAIARAPQFERPAWTTSAVRVDATAGAKSGAKAAATSATKTPEREALEAARAEGARVGQLDPDPLATERRLRAYALSLSAAQARALLAAAGDSIESGDARIAALQLAAWSSWDGDSDGKAQALVGFATRPLASPGAGAAARSAERQSFESALSALATEALVDLPSATARESLEKVAASAPCRFAVDRAERGLWHLRAGASKPEAQDREALSRLIK